MLEAGTLHKSESGTPQGGVVSPLIANLFLHYVLDRWFVETVQPRLRGASQLVRFADDCVPRRHAGERKLPVQLCCTGDGGRPSAAAVQAEAANHLLLLHLRGVVVSELGKGRA